MNQARFLSPQAMSEQQLRDDMALTPLERIQISFTLSRFAEAIHKGLHSKQEPPSAIPWIELRKSPLKKS